MGIAVVAAVVAVLIVAAAAGHHLLYRRPLPRIRGTVTLAGVSAPVRITRDSFGVPHIDAESIADAAFALGFVHAQDRGWQLELSRRVAMGRIAEFAGPDGLAADRFVRRLGLYRAAQAEERTLGGQARAVLDAYAAGVNAVLCEGLQPRPAELVLLGIRPEPWRPAHSLAYARVLSLGLALDMDMELQRLQLLRALGPDLAAQVDLAYPDANPTILAETAALVGGAGDEARGMFAEAARWLGTGGHAAASNSWVVDGSVTATGRPMLCNDPHLPPSVPSIWYEAHYRAGDDCEAAGVTFPGLPFVVIGHNRRIAWGFTNSFADCQDLVIEEFDSAQGQRYRTEDGWRDCHAVLERIAVKGAGEVVETCLETRHGPVLERFETGGSHRGLALQWTSLNGGGAAAGFLALQRAGGWDEFRRALNAVDGPSQNAVYADVDGHVGYFLSGHVPRRRRPASRLPVPGWDGTALWDGHLGVDEVPQVLDPPEHVVVTANNRIVGPGFPHHVAFDYMNGYRALRLERLLRGRTDMNMSFMAATQMDVVCPPAVELASLLAGVRCEGLAEEARQGLCAWDGVMDAAAAEPCVYEAFMRRLAEHALSSRLGESWRLLAGEMSHPVFGHAGNVTGRLTPWLLARWRADDRGLLADGETWESVAARAMGDAVADLRRTAGPPRRWRWGRLHQLPLQHPLSARRPLGVLFDAGRIEVGGDTDTVLQTAFVPGEPYRTRAWAPSWRQILDVGEWDACTGVHLPGQSGHPGSRHHRDLRERWRRNDQHPLHWSADAVAADARAVLVLQPPPVAVDAPVDAAEERAA